jgi:hypothetical protein
MLREKVMYRQPTKPPVPGVIHLVSPSAEVGYVQKACQGGKTSKSCAEVVGTAKSVPKAAAQQKVCQKTP